MTDIDPAAVMAAHLPVPVHEFPDVGCVPDVICRKCDIEWPCEPYRLAEALAAEREGHALTAAALVGTHEALAAEQAKVARLNAELDTWCAIPLDQPQQKTPTNAQEPEEREEPSAPDWSGSSSHVARAECGCSLFAVCTRHAAARPRGCTCHGPWFRSSSCQVFERPGVELGHAAQAALDPEHDPAALD